MKDMNLLETAMKDHSESVLNGSTTVRKGGAIDKNCLSYWFPVLERSGLPVPRTEIIRSEVNLCPLADGKEPSGLDGLTEQISEACTRIGAGPYFFRTGQGSGKHNWKNTCFLASSSPSLIRRHVCELFDWSQMVDFLGLRTDVWVVREMLPVEHISILERYGDFPLVKEVRGFVNGGQVLCSHPYWPRVAVREGSRIPDDDVSDMWFRRALATEEEFREAGQLLKQVATAFSDDGSWSVDVLFTKRGLFVTDMAEMHRSFHWPDCPTVAR